MTTPTQLREVYCAIDGTGADAVERDLIMQALVGAKSITEFAGQYPKAAKLHPVIAFRTQLDEHWRKVNRLLRHARNTSHVHLRTYMECIEHLRNVLRSRPNHRLCCALQKHAAHCDAMFHDLQHGRFVDSHALIVRDRLQEEIAKDAQELVKQIGRIDTDPDTDFDFQTAEPEEEERHEKFVKALENEYDISVHRWEPVREGLIVYIDEENTGKLATAIMHNDQFRPQDEFASFCDEHGYLMIRRGTAQDIDFGGFPEASSRWIFVYAPHDIEDWTDPDEIRKKDKERRDDTDKLANKLIRDIKALRIGDGQGKGVTKAGKRLGSGSPTAGIQGTIHPAI